VLGDVLTLEESYCVKVWNNVTAMNRTNTNRSNARMASLYLLCESHSCCELTFIIMGCMNSSFKRQSLARW
jgi:hypothetical protein